MNDDDTVEVETPNGEPITVPNDANILSVINSPISARKYASGTILTGERGKKYTIASSTLSSIDETTLEGKYTYKVIDLDTMSEFDMSEQEITDMLNEASVVDEETFEETKE
jgi:hypothetical protein